MLPILHMDNENLKDRRKSHSSIAYAGYYGSCQCAQRPAVDRPAEGRHYNDFGGRAVRRDLSSCLPDGILAI